MGERSTMKAVPGSLATYVLDSGILSSQHYPDGMRRGGRRTVCAHGVAGGKSLLQAAGGYSDALWRITRVIERGRHPAPW